MREISDPEDPSAIADMLAEVRRHIDRVQPTDLADEMAAGALVVDIRPVEQRQPHPVAR